ncbi:MAG: arylsulfotransferase family protein, partial [Thermodesulfobacteriota bacterium]
MLNKGKIISVVALLYLVSVGFFAWGLAAGHYKIFPWRQIEVVYWDLHAFFTFKDGPPKTVKEKILLDIQERPTQFDFSGFKLRDSTFQDTGYLLMPRYSKKKGQVIVELFSIADKKIVH